MSASQQQQQLLYQQLSKSTHNNNHQHHLNNQINSRQQQVPIKTANNTQQVNTTQNAQQMQRKLLTIFYVYAALVISVYATYAVYHLYQHHQVRRQHHLEQVLDEQSVAVSESLKSVRAADERSAGNEESQELRIKQLEQKLDKLHLFERYLDVMANELQDTRNRLREREKCDCSISCTFNNTRYQDRSTWQNQCDICTCRLGQISCSPQKCPPVACDDAVQLAGQCCPTCMKKCKHNNKLIKHNQRFNPSPEVANQQQQQQKECRCHDGRIKCELIQRSTKPFNTMAQNKSSMAQVTPQQRRIRLLSSSSTTTTSAPTSGQEKKPS